MVSRIVCSLLLVGLVISTPFSPCTDDNGVILPTPENVTIPGCVEDKCVFIRNQTYSFSLYDTSGVNTSSLTLQLNVSYTDRDTEVFRIPEDGCSRLTKGDCPLEVSEEYSYSRNITVTPSNETVDVETEFILFGDDDVVVTCFKINNTAIGS